MRLRICSIACLTVISAAMLGWSVPRQALAADESCVQCKHVDCIKGSIRRKKAMADGYDRIATKYERGWLDARSGKPAIEVDLAARYPDGKARAHAYREIHDEYKAYAVDEEALSNAAGAPEGCTVSNDPGVDGEGPSAGTDIETCAITGLPQAMRDSPCKRLGELLAGHEAMHQQSCERRGQTTTALVDPLTGRTVRSIPALLLTPAGKAREEASAYRMEVRELQALLKDAEKKCQTSFKGVKTSCVMSTPAGKVVTGQEISGEACGNPLTANWTVHTVNYMTAPYIGTQRNADPPWDSDCVARGSDEERQRAAIYSRGPGKGWMCVYDAGTPTRKPTVTIRAFRLEQCQTPAEETITVSVERGECEADPPPPPRPPRPTPPPSTLPVS